MRRLSYLGFMIIGLTSTINGIALPFLIDKFSLTLSVAGLLLFANSAGYLLSSFAFPFLSRRRPSTQILALAFLILGLSYTILPLSPLWAITVMIGFFASLGTGTIDVGLNTLIASLEPKKAESALNWLHFSYGVGALVGPVFLSLLIGLGLSWPSFYLTSGLLAFMFLFLWREHLKKSTKKQAASNKNPTGLYKEPFYWMLLMAIFIYVGVEVSLVGWIPTLLTNLQAKATDASLGISVLWLGIAIGRGLSARLVSRSTPRTLLLILTSSAALSMLALILIQPLWIVFIMLFCTGLFLSAIFPLIMLQSALLFPKTVAENTSGLLVAGSFGAMVGPFFLGLIGQHYSLQTGVAILACVMLVSTFIISALPRNHHLAPSSNAGAKVTD